MLHIIYNVCIITFTRITFLTYINAVYFSTEIGKFSADIRDESVEDERVTWNDDDKENRTESKDENSKEMGSSENMDNKEVGSKEVESKKKVGSKEKLGSKEVGSKEKAESKEKVGSKEVGSKEMGSEEKVGSKEKVGNKEVGSRNTSWPCGAPKCGHLCGAEEFCANTGRRCTDYPCCDSVKCVKK